MADWPRGPRPRGQHFRLNARASIPEIKANQPRVDLPCRHSPRVSSRVFGRCLRVRPSDHLWEIFQPSSSEPFRNPLNVCASTFESINYIRLTLSHSLNRCRPLRQSVAINRHYNSVHSLQVFWADKSLLTPGKSRTSIVHRA
jgi:hypothetical protein